MDAKRLVGHLLQILAAADRVLSSQRETDRSGCTYLDLGVEGEGGVMIVPRRT